MGRIKQIAEATEAELDTYLDHLGLDDNPFAHPATLDEYVLPGEDDIADVAAAIQSYTGPVLVHSRFSGAGKTTLLTMLLEDLRDDYRTIAVPEHNVTPYELVAIVADELGIGKSSSTKLTEQKIRNADLDEDVLIGIDEFGLNDPDTLHTVQFLNDQGFRVILTGMTSQWEAIGDLGSEGRAFQRRVSFQLELSSFAREQTRELFQRRLVTARGDSPMDVDLEAVDIHPFTEDALAEIHDRSKGVPAVATAAAANLIGLAAYRYGQTSEEMIDADLAAAVDYAEPEVEMASE
jgi:type II secretory pathway predicted ATPase ExeA